MADGRRMNVALHGKLLEEVECFKYLGSHVAVDRRIYGEVKYRMNEVRRVCGRMKKKVFRRKSLGLNANRMLHEEGVVLTVPYGAETWNVGATEMRRLNVMEYAWSNTNEPN